MLQIQSQYTLVNKAITCKAKYRSGEHILNLPAYINTVELVYNGTKGLTKVQAIQR